MYDIIQHHLSGYYQNAILIQQRRSVLCRETPFFSFLKGTFLYSVWILQRQIYKEASGYELQLGMIIFIFVSNISRKIDFAFPRSIFNLFRAVVSF